MGRVKNLFTIDPDQNFLEVLASEIWRRCEGDGFRLSRYLILLPTRRACRALGAVFARLAQDKPVLLPRLRPLGDVDEEEMAFADAVFPEILPAIAPLHRLMLLTQQVQKRDPALSCDQAAQAAAALAGFLDQIQIERCDITRLPELVEEQELAEHWQQTLLFLDIVTENWPKILQTLGVQDPQQRRTQVLQAQAELWHQTPPDFPVIAAGSTGSVPATADLLNVIADLPQGAVILPGLDRVLDNEAWDEVGDMHPQYNMKRLIAKIGVDRKVVTDFGSKKQSSPRLQLLSEAMRPSSVTENWCDLEGKLGFDAVKGLTRLALDHPQEEAQVIALRLRALLEEPDKTATFVTADRSLAMRVASLLRRWDIDVDDSGGAALSSLSVGSFLSLILAAASPYAMAGDYLALLKHPLSACGLIPALCRLQAREAEIRARQEMQEDFAALRTLLHPLTENWHAPLQLSERINLHISAAEKIAASDHEKGAARLWQGESGEDTAVWFAEWRTAAADFPALAGSDYTALFASLAGTKILRSHRTTHPRLSILGPLEARLATADLVIIGGLNEGVWPPDPGFDPFMSRPMREKFGLPSPEFRIGLSAHDLVQLTCGAEIMLTRSLRMGGTPTVPSRFLLQIEAVLRASGLTQDKQDALAPAEPWRVWAQALDVPAEIKACDPPEPSPPVALRPTSLSVTEIGTWRRNPYAIYAKHILKLKKLEELDAEFDAADRGRMIHAALEEFMRTYPDNLPGDAETRLLQIGQKIFASAPLSPRLRAFWYARFESIAGWFIDEERSRRAQGTKFLVAEAKGKTQIASLTLTGRADRVDLLNDGAVSIIDYKTGAAPKKKEVTSGIEPQLQLLALIAARGGFDNVPTAASGTFEYWELKGGSAGGDKIIFGKELPDLIAAAESGLQDLITAFADSATSYKAVPSPRLQPRHNDYAHLARVYEWSGTGGEG